MKTTIQVLSGLLIGSTTFMAMAQGTPPVQVTGWGRHQGGQIVYEYEVRNLSSEPVRHVLIGHDPGGRAAELSVAPAVTPGSLWLSSSAANRPPGWGAQISFPEESATFFVDWIEGAYFKELWPRAPSEIDAPVAVSGSGGISPGIAWKAFSVSVPRVDLAYVSGHASIEVNGDLVNVPIVKGDAVPPTLNATVSRINQNGSDGSWAIFEVQASVSDNFDPAPDIVFNPVTANQPIGSGDVVVSAKGPRAWSLKLRNVPGRAYQLKWTASDASGNTATRTYDYAVLSK